MWRDVSRPPTARCRPQDQWTPLHLGAAEGHAAVVRLLVDDPRVDVGERDGVSGEHTNQSGRVAVNPPSPGPASRRRA